MFGCGQLLFGCHPPPPAPPPQLPAPEPAPAPEPQIPEVVKNELDLQGANQAGCAVYKNAAEEIWGYKVQVELNLSVLIYDGVIVAADAEQLINHMNGFNEGWKERFASLCKHQKKGKLADGQYDKGATCLKQLLDVQKDYVNGLFYDKQFSLEAAQSTADHITDCDPVLNP